MRNALVQSVQDCKEIHRRYGKSPETSLHTIYVTEWEDIHYKNRPLQLLGIWYSTEDYTEEGWQIIIDGSDAVIMSPPVPLNKIQGNLRARPGNRIGVCLRKGASSAGCWHPHEIGDLNDAIEWLLKQLPE